MRLADALDRFVVQLEADGRSPHTIGQYRRHVALLGSWLALIPQAIAAGFLVARVILSSERSGRG